MPPFTPLPPAPWRAAPSPMRHRVTTAEMVLSSARRYSLLTSGCPAPWALATSTASTGRERQGSIRSDAVGEPHLGEAQEGAISSGNTSSMPPTVSMIVSSALLRRRMRPGSRTPGRRCRPWSPEHDRDAAPVAAPGHLQQESDAEGVADEHEGTRRPAWCTSRPALW